MDEISDDILDITPEELALFRECHFVHQVFEVKDALKSVEPLKDLEMLFDDEKRAEYFDNPENFIEIEGGWDHEHCDVCSIRINPGDPYWANERPGEVDLCERCYEGVVRLLGSSFNEEG